MPSQLPSAPLGAGTKLPNAEQLRLLLNYRAVGPELETRAPAPVRRRAWLRKSASLRSGGVHTCAARCPGRAPGRACAWCPCSPSVTWPEVTEGGPTSQPQLPSSHGAPSLSPLVPARPGEPRRCHCSRHRAARQQPLCCEPEQAVRRHRGWSAEVQRSRPEGSCCCATLLLPWLLRFSPFSEGCFLPQDCFQLSSSLPEAGSCGKKERVCRKGSWR